MAKKIMLLLALLLSWNVQAKTCEAQDASCDIEFTNEPSITNMFCDATQGPLAYVVKNNTPVTINLSNTIIKLPGDTSPDSSVSITGGSCANPVPAKSTCTIEVTIEAAPPSSAPFPQNIKRRLVVTPDTLASPISSDILLEVGCRNPIAISSGNVTDTNRALLAIHDVRGVWQTVSPPLAPNAIGNIFYSSTCSGNSPDSICIAVGREIVSSDSQEDLSEISLIYQSRNGGVTWSAPTIPNFPAPGALFGVGCNGDGSTATCMVVGKLNAASGSLNPGAVVLTTTNGGQTWTSANLTTSNPKALYNVAVGDGVYNVALGIDEQAASPPPYPYSYLVANNVSQIANYTLFDTSCSGNVCVAVGADVGLTTPVILYSTDNFVNINTVFASTSNKGLFTEVACTQANSKTICVAVGSIFNGKNSIPIMYINNDAAASGTWSPVALGTFPGNVGLIAVACTASPDASKAICTAAGLGLILQNIDTGSGDANDQWVNVTPSGTLPTTTFNGAACTSLDTAFCLVAGSGANAVYNNPDVENSTNWVVPPAIFPLPTTTVLSNAGANGSSSHSVLPLLQSPDYSNREVN